MSLLGDFLAGFAAGIPGVVDDIALREEKARKEKLIIEERERLKAERAAEMQRMREEKQADIIAERTYLEDKERRKQSDQDTRDQQFAGGYAASVNGVSPEQAAAAGKGGLLSGEIEGAMPQDGMGPGAPTQGVDLAKSRKVFADFNAALTAKRGGAQSKEIMGVLRDREEQQAFNNLDANGKEQWAREKQLREGKNPDLVEARIEALKAQADASEARARKSDRGPAGSSAGEIRDTNRLTAASADITRAEAAVARLDRDIADAREKMKVGRKDEGAVRALNALVAKRDAAEAEGRAAKQVRKELLGGSGQNTEKPTGSRTPHAPSAFKVVR